MPDRRRKPHLVPSDSLFAQQWYPAGGTASRRFAPAQPGIRRQVVQAPSSPCSTPACVSITRTWGMPSRPGNFWPVMTSSLARARRASWLRTMVTGETQTLQIQADWVSSADLQNAQFAGCDQSDSSLARHARRGNQSAQPPTTELASPESAQMPGFCRSACSANVAASIPTSSPGMRWAAGLSESGAPTIRTRRISST